MSADCAAASVLTRLLIWGSEILASSMSMSKPSRGARRSSVRTPVEAMNVLDGTQSNSTQAPPMPSESTTVTWADSRAGGGDQCGLVTGRPPTDDHDARRHSPYLVGCHGRAPQAATNASALQPRT